MRVEKLKSYGLVYLATPYSKYPAGIQVAFEDAAKLVAKLIPHGLSVYSPICHTHPIAVYGNINPLSHAIWLNFDMAMMRACDALLIGKLQGWKESHGIEQETVSFALADKPIYHIDPETLEVE